MYVSHSITHVDCSGVQLIGLFRNVQDNLIGCPIWVCICKSANYLVVQTIDDVAYKLSDLVKRIFHINRQLLRSLNNILALLSTSS